MLESNGLTISLPVACHYILPKRIVKQKNDFPWVIPATLPPRAFPTEMIWIIYPRGKRKIMLTSYFNCAKYRPKTTLASRKIPLKEVMRGKKISLITGS